MPSDLNGGQRSSSLRLKHIGTECTGCSATAFRTKISQLAAVQASLDLLIDAGQAGEVASLGAKAAANVARLSETIQAAGLSPRAISCNAPLPASAAPMGGPYIAVKYEDLGAAFGDGVAHDADQLALADRLAAVLPSIPLHKPLPGEIEVTSPFGPRLDPFLGKMAVHPGVDLRDGFGTDVHATAAGTVDIRPGADAGYGNMVEIDHGHGIVTPLRPSLVNQCVSEGDQKATAGTVVGRLGSTGRSTGPSPPL